MLLFVSKRPTTKIFRSPSVFTALIPCTAQAASMLSVWLSARRPAGGFSRALDSRCRRTYCRQMHTIAGDRMRRLRAAGEAIGNADADTFGPDPIGGHG